MLGVGNERREHERDRDRDASAGEQLLHDPGRAAGGGRDSLGARGPIERAACRWCGAALSAFAGAFIPSTVEAASSLCFGV